MKNQFALKSLLIVFIFAQTGCSSDLTPVEKTFRLGWSSLPRSIDPRFSVDADDKFLGGLLHCSLLRFDSKGKTQNQVASNVQWIDNKTLEVTLDPSFTFWDGQKVTAEDIKANYDYLRTKVNQPQLTDPSPLQFSYSNLQDVEVVDDSTESSPNSHETSKTSQTQEGSKSQANSQKLRFHLLETDGDWLEHLSLGILPKRLAEGPRVTDPKKLMGCGNFQLERIRTNAILLKRVTLNSSNLPSSQSPVGDVQYVRMEIVKDANTALLKLRNSELDMVQGGLNLDQLIHIELYKNLKLIRVPALHSTTYLGLQMNDPILKHRSVRQALLMSIDRKKMITHLFHGWATLATSFLAPSDPYFNSKLKAIEYNPEKAKALLDQAGFVWKDPTQPRFTLKLSNTTNPIRMVIAHTVADDLNKVGIHLQIQSSDWGKFKEDVDRGLVQMWPLIWIGFKGPSIFSYIFSSRSFPPYGANRGHYSNPKLDDLLAQVRGETDFTKRKIKLNQVQELLSVEVPYLFLWHEDRLVVLNERVQGYEVDPDGGLDGISKVTFLKSISN